MSGTPLRKFSNCFLEKSKDLPMVCFINDDRRLNKCRPLTFTDSLMIPTANLLYSGFKMQIFPTRNYLCMQATDYTSKISHVYIMMYLSCLSSN